MFKSSLSPIFALYFVLLCSNINTGYATHLDIMKKEHVL